MNLMTLGRILYMLDFASFCNVEICFAGKAKEEKTLESIGNARKRVSEEISQVKEKLKRHKNAIQTLKEELVKLDDTKSGSVM